VGSSYPPPDLALEQRAIDLGGLGAGGGEDVAAAKAALRAMLRMLPPAMLRLARRAGSMPVVGVAGGKTRDQRAARWAASGKGKSTKKRMRRWKLLSREFLRLEVRMAMPWKLSMRWRR
jgi:hypothetical protein